MPKSFITNRRVEFCETDAAGIVHFSSLFCYMEQAEHAFLRSLGTSVVTGLQGGRRLSWPRVRAECDYSGRMQFEDVLEIRLRITRLGRTSCTYQFDFFSPEVKLVASGLLVAVCCQIDPVASSIEPISIPDSLRAKMADYCCDP